MTRQQDPRYASVATEGLHRTFPNGDRDTVAGIAQHEDATETDVFDANFTGLTQYDGYDVWLFVVNESTNTLVTSITLAGDTTTNYDFVQAGGTQTTGATSMELAKISAGSSKVGSGWVEISAQTPVGTPSTDGRGVTNSFSSLAGLRVLHGALDKDIGPINEFRIQTDQNATGVAVVYGYNRPQ